MYKKPGYPKLIIDLNKLRTNIDKVQNMCRDQGVEIAGIIKGFSGLIPCVQQYERAGCSMIGSSRLEQLEPLRQRGIQTPLLMIRVPMLSEAEEVVRICDYSLNSDIQVLKELNVHAGLQDRTHNVILMADLGDLREGFWGREEILEAALLVENELHNLHLAGVGTNVGCYGSVLATPQKLQELVDIAEYIEENIGRELEIISGGATSSLMRVVDGNLPRRINMLRIGEGIILNYDLPNLYGYEMEGLFRDVFRLRAEIIEVRDKPSHPVGEIGFDAFGHQVVYEDRGIRKRALLGIGKADYGDPAELICLEEGAEVLGASSDHTILDVQDVKRTLKTGDIIEFEVKYATVVYLTASPNIEKVYI